VSPRAELGIGEGSPPPPGRFPWRLGANLHIAMNLRVSFSRLPVIPGGRGGKQRCNFDGVAAVARG